MKYACLVYHDRNKVADPSDAEQLAAIIAAQSHWQPWKAELEKVDYPVYSAGLQSVRTATTVRKCNGKLSMTNGVYEKRFADV